MTQYKLSEVRQVCEAIYGRSICDRTWLKWKSKLGFDKYVKEISESKMEQILTLANMKRATPYDNVTLEKVVKAKQKVLKNLQATQNNYKLYLLPNHCKGSDIPEILRMVSGRKVSRKSLYRWGVTLNQEYSTTKNYSKDEVLRYLSKIFVVSQDKKPEHCSEKPEAA